jgi:hypothetical protein
VRAYRAGMLTFLLIVIAILLVVVTYEIYLTRVSAARMIAAASKDITRAIRERDDQN